MGWQPMPRQRRGRREVAMTMHRLASLFVIVALALVRSSMVRAAAPDQVALDKLGFRLACQAYTFREMTAFETLDLLKRLGIRYIEFYPGQKLSPDRSDLKVGPELPADQIARLKEKLKD